MDMVQYDALLTDHAFNFSSGFIIFYYILYYIQHITYCHSFRVKTLLSFNREWNAISSRN